MNTAEDVDLSTLSHRSPGITADYNELKRSRRNRVLDLGSSSAASFNFFATLSCQFRFENLNSFVGARVAESFNAHSFRTALGDYLLSFSQEEKFDVILAWDIFDYLDLECIEWLVKKLTQHCHTDTLLHCIKHVGDQIPTRPRQYQVVNQYQVRICCTTALSPRPFAHPNITRLLQHMPGYYIESSYMSHAGMTLGVTEHLLRYVPEGRLRKQQTTFAEISAPSSLPETESVLHRSYGLSKIFADPATLANARVLDLSPRSSHHSEFLLERVNSLYAEDPIPALVHSSVSDCADQHIRQHALRFDSEMTFDIILAWDLFNYCTLAQIEAIYQKLQPHTHAGSQIWALLYAGLEVPSRPRSFHIVDSRQLLVSGSSTLKPRAAHLTSASLLKILQGFTLTDTFIFQPGMQRGIYEYVLQAVPLSQHNQTSISP